MKLKKVLSLVVTGALLVSMCPSVFAYEGYTEVTEAGGTGYSDVTLTVENTGGSVDPTPPVDPTDPPVDPPVDPTDPPVDPPIDPTDPPVDPPIDPVLFSAYVPTQLPIKMNLQGNIAVPNNAKIINGVGSKGICVTAINVTPESDWSIVGYSEDFTTKSADTREVGILLRDDVVNNDGTVVLSEDNWKIAKDSYIDLVMGVKIPKQTVSGDKGKVATIEFTLDWSGDDVSTGPSIPDDGIITPTPPVTPEEPDKPSDTSELSVNWDNGLMLPGSTNTAVFNWNSTNSSDKIISLVSSNPDVAEAPSLASLVSPMAETESYNGTLPVNIEAKIKGTTTITATLETGATSSFDVIVSELNTDENPSGEIKPDKDLNEGDTLKPGDITVTIPVVKPDGSTEDVVITPDEVPDTPLKPGDNDIEIDVEVNGVIIKIIIRITIVVQNPSNGSSQTVAEAQAMGFTFASYQDGLAITAFENKQFKSEINVPENIGDFKVLKIGDNAFKGQTNIKKVTLPDTVTELGVSSFEGCTNLENIGLSQNLRIINNNAFKNCTLLEISLKSANLNSIGNTSFIGIKSLEIGQPDGDLKIISENLGTALGYAINSNVVVTLSNSTTSEIIPVNTVVSTYLLQDKDRNWVNIKAEWISNNGKTITYPSDLGDISFPAYFNGKIYGYKGVPPVLSYVLCGNNTLVHFADYYEISLPFEFAIDKSFGEMTSVYGLNNKFIHYLDKWMIYGVDATGCTYDSTIPKVTSSYQIAQNEVITVKGKENWTDNNWYFGYRTDVYSASSNNTSMVGKLVPKDIDLNGWKVTKTGYFRPTTPATQYLEVFYLDKEQGIVSNFVLKAVSWNTDKISVNSIELS